MIAEIRNRGDGQGFIQRDPPRFRRGQSLHILAGPMADSPVPCEEAVSLRTSQGTDSAL